MESEGVSEDNLLVFRTTSEDEDGENVGHLLKTNKKSIKVRSKVVINLTFRQLLNSENIVSGFKMTRLPKSLLLGIKGFISTPFCVNFQTIFCILLP